MRKTVLYALLAIMCLVLSACGTQAPKGTLYVSSAEKAEVVTVVNMSQIRRCTVANGSVAYASRETYFDSYIGGGNSERTLLTQIIHSGEGCSSGGSYDFIRESPGQAGWTEVKPGTDQWFSALKTLCRTNRTKSDDLQSICANLNQ